jgi:hypothetical protein
MLEHLRALSSKILLEGSIKHSTSVLLETMLDLSCSPQLLWLMMKKVVPSRYLYEISVDDGALKLLPSYRRAYAYVDDAFSMSLRFNAVHVPNALVIPYVVVGSLTVRVQVFTTL